jgi:ribonuclease HI
MRVPRPPQKLVAATDGSALRNPVGPAGWCWYVSEGCWAADGWPAASNNVAELTAVRELLRATEPVHDLSLRVLCDSQYAVKALETWWRGWRRNGWRSSSGEPVKNRELIEEILALREGRQVQLEWVRGHAGHSLNEAADLRAVAVSTAIDEGDEPDQGPGWTGFLATRDQEVPDHDNDCIGLGGPRPRLGPTLVAKSPGTCPWCGTSWLAGVAITSVDRRWHHEECARALQDVWARAGTQ